MTGNEQPEILFFRLLNSKDILVAQLGNISDFPSSFFSNPTETRAEGGYRYVYRKNDKGTVQFIVSEKAPSFQTKRSFSATAEVFFSLIPTFSRVEYSQRQSFASQMSRFAHNLVNFQKKFKEPFERLVSDDARERPFIELKNEIKRKIEEDTSLAAEEVTTMSMRAIDLDAQIATLSVIGGFVDKKKVSLFPVNLRRAMYRFTNPFLSELSQKNVSVVIDIDDSVPAKAQAKISRSLFNVCISQIFDNACKYVRPGTTIQIKMDPSSPRRRLVISMTSVTIDPDETETIFLENTRGRHARKVKSSPVDLMKEGGSGIGLFIVRRALGYMKANISVTNNGYVDSVDDISYSKHEFAIEFFG